MRWPYFSRQTHDHLCSEALQCEISAELAFSAKHTVRSPSGCKAQDAMNMLLENHMVQLIRFRSGEPGASSRDSRSALRLEKIRNEEENVATAVRHDIIAVSKIALQRARECQETCTSAYCTEHQGWQKIFAQQPRSILWTEPLLADAGEAQQTGELPSASIEIVQTDIWKK